MHASNGGGIVCECKVGRMIDSYDLTGMNEQLVEWWGSDEEGRSLRELTEHLNQELLRRALETEGYTPLDGEVANTYRLLTGNDVSQGMRLQARNRLEREGIEVDRLTDDFVSYQSVYRHLKDCLEEEYEEIQSSASDQRERTKERIATLESRTEMVTNDALSRLRDQEALALEEFEVIVDVSVNCLACGNQHTIDELVAARGCHCQVTGDL